MIGILTITLIGCAATAAATAAARSAARTTAEPEPVPLRDAATPAAGLHGGASARRVNQDLYWDFVSKPDEESYRAPYWAGGHWVYYRPPTTRLPHTRGPAPSTSTRPGHSTTTRAFASTRRDCNPTCLNMFQDLGPVCGARTQFYVFAWWPDYRTFHDICELEYENCMRFQVRGWHVLARGACVQEYANNGRPRAPLPSDRALPARAAAAASMALRFVSPAYQYNEAAIRWDTDW